MWYGSARQSPLHAARKTSFLLVAALAGAAWLGSGRASAQVDEDFRAAREAYSGGDLPAAIRLLEPLVGAAVPSIEDRVLVREARKYLAAAYVIGGRVEDAEQQFRWLLDENREELEAMRLDPRVFITEVRAVFERVQAAMIAEARQAAAETDAERARQEALRREALIALLAQAQEHEVVVENPELPMFVPFGVGQFVNGDEGLGWTFALSEGFFALASFATMSAAIYVDDAYRQMDGRIVGGYDLLLEGLWIANAVSGLVFLVLAVTGIVEARLSWQPTRTVRQRREIAPEILDRLELGVNGVGLRF